jgi:hypothetical protein
MSITLTEDQKNTIERGIGGYGVCVSGCYPEDRRDALLSVVEDTFFVVNCSEISVYQDEIESIVRKLQNPENIEDLLLSDTDAIRALTESQTNIVFHNFDSTTEDIQKKLATFGKHLAEHSSYEGKIAYTSDSENPVIAANGDLGGRVYSVELSEN